MTATMFTLVLCPCGFVASAQSKDAAFQALHQHQMPGTSLEYLDANIARWVSDVGCGRRGFYAAEFGLSIPEVRALMARDQELLQRSLLT